MDGILFDKDGTLLDFAELWVYWGKKWIQTIMQNAETIDKEHSLGQSIGLYIEQNTWDPAGPLASASMSELEAILTYRLYINGMDWGKARTIVVRSQETVDNSICWKDRLKPIDGLETLLAHACSNSIQMGVITSDTTVHAKQNLRQMEIIDYFGCIVGNDAVRRGKPFPDMVYQACRELNIRPYKTIVIGDSNGDMVAGKNAEVLASIGIVSENIKNTKHLKDADVVINDYKDRIL